MERLIGLTEMFPNSVRNVVGTGSCLMFDGVCWSLSAGRAALWILASSSVMLALPIIFERERAQMEEHRLNQQRQVSSKKYYLTY